jgi:hypothetical protein
MLQVCMVFSWLISKSDPKKVEVTTSVVIGMNLSTIRSRHAPFLSYYL